MVLDEFNTLAKNKENINKFNEHGLSLINSAILRKKKEFVTILIEVGADLNKINPK